MESSSVGHVDIGLMFEPGQHCNSMKGSGILNILIKQVKNISPTVSSKLADFSIELILLPNRHAAGRRFTRAITNTLNPVWEEKFAYEDVIFCYLLEEYVLEISLFQGEDEFIGGVRLGGHPGRSSEHQAWMDCVGWEATHWERMLSCPGQWIEGWHALRSSLDPQNVDLSQKPLPFAMPQFHPDAVSDIPGSLGNAPDVYTSQAIDKRVLPRKKEPKVVHQVRMQCFLCICTCDK